MQRFLLFSTIGFKIESMFYMFCSFTIILPFFVNSRYTIEFEKWKNQLKCTFHEASV